MLNKLVTIIFSGIFFFLIVLFQESFISLYINFNFAILLLIIINLIEDPKRNFGLISAFFVGIFMDLNSAYFFGLYTISFVVIAMLIKTILFKFLRTAYVSWLPKI